MKASKILPGASNSSSPFPITGFAENKMIGKVLILEKREPITEELGLIAEALILMALEGEDIFFDEEWGFFDVNTGEQLPIIRMRS
jgi:hypothetical protein